VRVSIYKITNKLNGKAYIGKTEQEPSVRWRQHVTGMGYGKKMPIHLALKRYGVKNFNFEIVYMCFDSECAGYAEVFFINKYNCLAPHGYNLEFQTTFIKDNPYLIVDTKKSTAVQSIPSEPAKAEYKLGKRTRYPLELWNEIKSLYTKGYTPKDINKMLGTKIPHRTMLGKLKALGCNTSNKARNAIRGKGRFLVTDFEKQNIVLDFQKGLTPIQLEKKHKRSSKIIKKALVEAGLYVSRDKKICRTVQRCTEVVDKKPLR
jgi:group I intron endonuclease